MTYCYKCGCNEELEITLAKYNFPRPAGKKNWFIVKPFICRNPLSPLTDDLALNLSPDLKFYRHLNPSS